MEIYHVTTRENARKITAEGFTPGWGDAGLGVYFWDNLSDAEDHMADGGWEGKLDPDEAVILSAEVDDFDVEYIDPDPHWPNPEDYDTVVWRRMQSDNDRWKPEGLAILDHTPSPTVF